MGIAQRREREREEMRELILDAARDLFTREGFDRVTMRRIADAIEYSPTAIYLHFKDKDELLKACCEAEFTRLLTALDPQALPADPVARIRALGLAYARFGLGQPSHYRFMFMTSVGVKHDHTPEAPGVQSFLILRAAVAEAIESGRFRPELDPDTAAQVLWSGLHGAVALLITYQPGDFPHKPAAPDLLDQVMDTMARGLLAPGQTLER